MPLTTPRPRRAAPPVARLTGATLLGLSLMVGSPSHAAEVVTTTLDSGLVVVVERQDRTDTVASSLVIGVGSRDERDGERGFAHLFEHLMYEGSAHAPGNAYDTWLTEAGGTNNAWTGDDRTVYHATFPSGALERVLFLESDRLGHTLPALTEDAVRNQRDVVLQERSEAMEAPHGRDVDALQRLVYPADHPYHGPVFGTVADVESASVDAVRGFFRRHYRPDNAVLVLVGRLDPERVVERVAHWFSDVPRPEAPPLTRLQPDVHPALPRHATPRRGVLEDAVQDWTVHLGWPTVPETHPEAPALVLASYVLSYGRGTLLDDAFHWDDQQALSVEANAWHSEIDGLFKVSISAPGPTLAPLADEALEIVAQLGRRGPPKRLLDRLRAAVFGSWADAMQTPEGRAAQWGHCQVVFGIADCVEAERARYEAVTPGQIAAAVRRWLPADRAHALSVVPQGQPGALPGSEPVALP